MNAWSALSQELDHWSAAGRQADFWWRDDDAVDVTPDLEALLAAADGTPINIAVIPGLVRESLVPVLAACKNVSVSQHGYAHVNHAPEGEKKAEFRGGRDRSRLEADIFGGRDHLKGLFGRQFVSVFVPPWNRVDDLAADVLEQAGFALLSTFNARSGDEAGPKRLNTHMDIVDWRGHRGFAGDDLVLGQAVRHLQARRTGAADLLEPTGLLSHHLVHDRGCWNFLNEFNLFIQDHPAARWVDIADIAIAGKGR